MFPFNVIALTIFCYKILRFKQDLNIPKIKWIHKTKYFKILTFFLIWDKNTILPFPSGWTVQFSNDCMCMCGCRLINARIYYISSRGGEECSSHWWTSENNLLFPSSTHFHPCYNYLVKYVLKKRAVPKINLALKHLTACHKITFTFCTCFMHYFCLTYNRRTWPPTILHVFASVQVYWLRLELWVTFWAFWMFLMLCKLQSVFEVRLPWSIPLA